MSEPAGRIRAGAGQARPSGTAPAGRIRAGAGQARPSGTAPAVIDRPPSRVTAHRPGRVPAIGR
jgi:hypothetical protein